MGSQRSARSWLNQHSRNRWHPSIAIHLAIQLARKNRYCIDMHTDWCVTIHTHWCLIVYTHTTFFFSGTIYAHQYRYLIYLCAVYSSLSLYSSSPAAKKTDSESPSPTFRYYGHCCSHWCQSGFASFEQERWDHIFLEKFWWHGWRMRWLDFSGRVWSAEDDGVLSKR